MDQFRFYQPSLLDQKFGLCISPQDLLFPYYDLPNVNYYRPWKRSIQKSKDCGSTIHNQKNKFKIYLDVQHFQPSEINVKVSENEIIIEANHEEKKDDHGFISRRFKRRYLLPKECIADSVASSLSSDGVLTVTADKCKELEEKEIIVPIKISSNCPNKGKPETETTLKSEKLSEDVKISDADANKKNFAIMLKEDHCRLLKPELFGKTATTAKENKSIEAKDTSDLLCTINTDKTSNVIGQSGQQKTEELFEQSKETFNVATFDTLESVAGRSKETLESCSNKNRLSETIEIQQSTSSYSSSMSSSLKETTAKINELVSDISAQLKEAAENI